LLEENPAQKGQEPLKEEEYIYQCRYSSYHLKSHLWLPAVCYSFYSSIRFLPEKVSSIFDKVAFKDQKHIVKPCNIDSLLVHFGGDFPVLLQSAVVVDLSALPP